VFVDLRSGASGRAGETRLVAWRGCRPRDLFRYDSDRPTRRPHGTVDVSSFALVVKDIERRFKGLELRLSEGFVFCCPSVQKLTYLRYDRRSDRYVRYRTRQVRRSN